MKRAGRAELIFAQQRQLFRSSIARRTVPLRWPRGIKFNTAVALEQDVQGYFTLQPSQMRAQATVWPQPKAQSAPWPRADIELLWVDKMRWIAVRGGDAKLDDRARGDCYPTNADILEGDTGYQSYWRFEPKRLFDEVREQGWFVT